MRRHTLLGGLATLGLLLAVGSGAAEPEGTRVVARVNQVDITYADLKLRVEVMEQERGPMPTERYGDILRALVREEILAQAVDRDGLEKEPAMRRRVELARRQVLIEELLRRRVAARSQLSDEELRKAYEENKPLFTTEGVAVSHILVKTEAEAQEIRKALDQGKPFAEIAKAASLDAGSAESGGDLGVVSQGQTEPEFETAAFALKAGELSAPVKTQYGYHILKGGAHSTTLQPFEEAKPKLQEMLGRQRQRDALIATMAELEKQSQVELFEDRLK
jgi:parvulin-like peptidyl-prolyl isomerase